MSSLTLSRCTLSVCAAATLLVGCGGLQPAGVAQGPVPQGQMPENPARVAGVGQSPRSVRQASVTETVLYSFGTNGNDGLDPAAGLTYFNGTFYGTTFYGGAPASGCHDTYCGTVYSITPSGTETVLHSFAGGEDGSTPLARLIVRNGTLYGTTSYRGEKCEVQGCGTVFSITPSGQETVLHGFTGSPDGARPKAALRNVNGTLYGTTTEGGAYNNGAVFTITPGGNEKVLYSFRAGRDGVQPEADLVDVKGTLYGTTGYGGNYDNGTVFSITPGGKEKVLYSFGAHDPYDGVQPAAGLVDVNGTLYGTTEAGGAHNDGTVFSITLGGKEKVLHSFSGRDGDHPSTALLSVHGNSTTLYGTAAGGAYSYGTFFSITVSGHETVLYSFKGYTDGDGEGPNGLSYVNGTFYGTTDGGGAHGNGIVFSITL